MRERIEHFLFLAFKSGFRVLPRPLCLALGRGFGRLAFHASRRHRRIALANLRTAFGTEKTPEELRRIALASFRHFGSVLTDIFKLAPLVRQEREKLVDVEGWENLTGALAEGKGVLVMSAHLGNWEMGSLMISRAAPFHVIARALDNRLMEKELQAFRETLGARVIHKQQAARKVLQALRDKEIVAILIDQNVLRSQAVFVDFFGRPAATTPALGAFHLRTGAPIVPVFCLPAPGNRYRLKILPPLSIDLKDDLDENVLKITGICTKMIEKEITRTPDCWLWFHDRWRSRPEHEHSIKDKTD